jgi:hypothetical protein
LTPEVGAVLQRALEAAADRLLRDTATAPMVGTLAEEVTPAQRRADALGLLAETALSAGLDTGHAGDRYQVVVHVTADAHAEARWDRPTRTPDVVSSSETHGTDAGGVLELDHGALHVSAETSRRLGCDASVVRMTHDGDGTLLDVSRKTRSIPPAIRRALAARDRLCRFPGCASRRCDAHHIEHWADGGGTRLDNLVLLCRRHHRAVHEGGFAVVRYADGDLSFSRPDGANIPPSPALPATEELDWAEAGDQVPAPPPVWDGTPFDLGWAIDVLYAPSGSGLKNSHEEEMGCGSCGNRSVVSKELVGALPV